MAGAGAWVSHTMQLHWHDPHDPHPPGTNPCHSANYMLAILTSITLAILTSITLAILVMVLARGEGVGPTQWANVNGGATNKIFLI